MCADRLVATTFKNQNSTDEAVVDDKARFYFSRRSRTSSVVMEVMDVVVCDEGRRRLRLIRCFPARSQDRKICMTPAAAKPSVEIFKSFTRLNGDPKIHLVLHLLFANWKNVPSERPWVLRL
jgi:hypothetical protein